LSASKTSSASVWASGKLVSTPENAPSESASDRANVLSQVQPDDLVEFGMIPEFVGRLPLWRTLEPLDVKTLIKHLIRAQERAGEAISEVFPNSKGARTGVSLPKRWN